MKRYRNCVLSAASLSLGLLAVAPARAASLTQVNRSDWAVTASLPSDVSMHIYVPDKPAAKPPIVVSAHSCGSTADGQMGNITKVKAAADKLGFLIIVPDFADARNCWDVGSDKSLKHDGGGDTQAFAEMVKYALKKYSGDASRVYIFGGSSGGMMTQAMLAVYPDVFMAGSARAGVPAGCWADGYRDSDQWSDSCAGGSVAKSADDWGKLVRAMDPNYSGHRPRVQLFHGTSDSTINYKNMGEAIKEWTNVLGLSDTPTSKESNVQGIDPIKYERQIWKNDCGAVVLDAYSGTGGTHSMKYEEDFILKFFGLDAADTPDPEAACLGGGGPDGGSGSADGGGASGAGGRTTGAKDAGVEAGRTDTDGGGKASAGGSSNAGGAKTTGAGGSKAGKGGSEGGESGGSGAGSLGKGGSSGTGSSGSEGSATAGKSSTNASTSGKGGSSNEGGAKDSAGAEGDDSSSDLPSKQGCGCLVGSHGMPRGALAGLMIALGGALLRRSHRRDEG